MYAFFSLRTVTHTHVLVSLRPPPTPISKLPSDALATSLANLPVVGPTKHRRAQDEAKLDKARLRQLNPNPKHGHHVTMLRGSVKNSSSEPNPKNF